MEDNLGKKRNGKILSCKSCSQEFYVPKYRIETAVFCSMKCMNHLQYEKSNHKCTRCFKEFLDSPSRKGRRLFCTLVCMHSFFSERSANVKDRRRNAIAKLRAEGKVSNNGPAIRKWVLLSKINECMICGYNEHICCLDIHHIDNDPNNNTLENIGILCVMCHRKVHRKLIKL